MRPDQVTACIVTRGNVDLDPIIGSLIFTNVIVYDNSKRGVDAKTYGRYLAAEEATTDFVYFQDDDVIVPRQTQRKLLQLHRPGVLVANMEEWRNRDAFREVVWVGWGALTERSLYRQAFADWLAAGRSMDDEWFSLVGCDIVFSMLAPQTKRVDLGHTHLDYAYDDTRTWKMPGFSTAKMDFYEGARLVRSAR